MNYLDFSKLIQPSSRYSESSTSTLPSRESNRLISLGPSLWVYRFGL